MCYYELVGLILFVAVLAIVYAPAIYFISRRLITRKPARFLVLEKAIFSVASIGLVLMAYGYFIEPYWLEINRVSVESAKLSAGSRPIRIVHISDLHCDPQERLESKLPGIVAAENPDVIVFTGDSINSKAGLDNFRRCLNSLAAIAPTFAVEGNHDSRCWSDLDLFGKTKVRNLNGQSEKLEVQGQTIYLAGVSVDSEALLGRSLQAVPPSALTLFLYHSPDLIFDLAKKNVDFCFAGHTHGGQVCLPWYGAVITQSKFGKQFEWGLYRVLNTWMYVNRGIGMEGGIDPRVRFLARPEVTVIDICPKHSASAVVPSGPN